jgi:hypothetical protein
MEIHFIRHGVTIHNEQSRFNGWLDEGITLRQAKELQRVEFSVDRFDAIYCSPLKRCIETARALGIPEWIEEPRLKERNLGIFEGKAPMECETPSTKMSSVSSSCWTPTLSFLVARAGSRILIVYSPGWRMRAGTIQYSPLLMVARSTFSTVSLGD